MRLFALLVVIVAPGAMAQAQGADPRDVARAVHAEAGYAERLFIQNERGEAVPFPPAASEGADSQDAGARRGPGDGRTDGIEGRIEGRANTTDAQAPGPSFDMGGLGRWLTGLFELLSKLLLVAVVAGLLAFLVYLLFRFARPSKAAPVDAPAPAPPDPDALDLPAEVGDPDALAAAGRFDEAIVALLVNALKHVGWEPGSQRGLTAREVLAALADARRGPLTEIVRGAERVRFAGDAADEATYGRLRRWYDALLGTSPGTLATEGPAR